MKYRAEVGSFCTRYIERKITVYAKDEEEARQKAIDKFWGLEYKLPNSNDAGSPQVDEIKQISS